MYLCTYFITHFIHEKQPAYQLFSSKCRDTYYIFMKITTYHLQFFPKNRKKLSILVSNITNNNNISTKEMACCANQKIWKSNSYYSQKPISCDVWWWYVRGKCCQFFTTSRLPKRSGGVAIFISHCNGPSPVLWANSDSEGDRFTLNCSNKYILWYGLSALSSDSLMKYRQNLLSTYQHQPSQEISFCE